MTTSAPVEPVLDADEIQGNVVPGFLKPHMALVALAIDDVAAAKRWLGDVADQLTTLRVAMVSREKVRAHRGFRAEKRLATLGEIPDGVDDAWVNLAVSRGALDRLLHGGRHAPAVAQFADAGFQHGLAARSSLLGDPVDSAADGNPRNWVIGGPDNEADVLLVFGADRAEECVRILEEIREAAVASGLRLLYEERGAKLDDIGSEHFGFQDGVSQPGVRGRYDDTPASFVTPHTIDPEDTPDAWLYGLPGQYLVWPGEFVFGYPKSAADPLMPGAINLPGPAWCRNGSYLVFRRLRQDVPAFRTFVEEQTRALNGEPGEPGEPGFAGVSTDWVGSRIVGRWKSGAPVSRVPDADDVNLGIDRYSNNDFGYAAPAKAPPLASGHAPDSYPEAPADPIGLTCPMGAHIRKVNTRETPNDLGGRRASFARRILRRALPFGPPLPDPPASDPALGDRGLLFVSYQASIADQFEFLCNSWMGSATNPRSPGGFDLFIGEDGAPGAGRERHATIFGQGAATATLTTTTDWVVPTGGGYFFSPSISALREVLAA